MTLAMSAGGLAGAGLHRGVEVFVGCAKDLSDPIEKRRGKSDRPTKRPYANDLALRAGGRHRRSSDTDHSPQPRLMREMI
jgi:hypothetical protein